MKKYIFLLVLLAAFCSQTQAQLTCPANITLNTNSDLVSNYNCSNLVKAADNVAPGITGTNTSLTHTVSGATVFSGSGTAAGIVFNGGVSTVRYNLTGSTATCTFTVTIKDSEPPKLLAGFAPTKNVYDSNCDIFPKVSLPSPIYNDNCGGAAYSFFLLKDTILNVGGCASKAKALKYTKNLKRTWTAIDQSGNKLQYIQNFYSRDSTGVPIATLPPVARTWTGAVVSVPALSFDNGTVTEGCTPNQALSWSICKGANCTSYASGITVYSEFVAGQTIQLPVTIRVTDKCGNQTYKNTTIALTR